jgi:hypothetical protein
MGTFAGFRKIPLPAKYFLLYLAAMSEYSIGEALKKFLRGSKLKGDIQAMQITDIWESLMGKTIARYTDSIKIYGDKLYISTKMAPLKQELLFQKENIILRVNEALRENIIREVIIN